MKHYLPLFLIVLLFLPSLACNAATPNSVRGSGKIVQQTVDVNNFDSISLDGSGDVYIEQGKTESLTIEADDNILPLLDTRVQGHELVLGMKPNQSINPSQAVIYRLKVKDLNGIALKGSGNFHIETVQSTDMSISLLGSGDITIKELSADDLSMDLDGSGNIMVGDIQVKTISTSVKGSGDIKLTGTADDQTISVAGSGNYLAEELETSSADINIPGSADVTVWVKDTLKVSINGSGNIRYYGKPTVDQRVNGSGKVISMGEK